MGNLSTISTPAGNQGESFWFSIPEKFILMIPAGIYLLQNKNQNTRTMREIFSKLTIKRPEWHHWKLVYCSGVFWLVCVERSCSKSHKKLHSWLWTRIHVLNYDMNDLNVDFLVFLKPVFLKAWCRRGFLEAIRKVTLLKNIAKLPG